MKERPILFSAPMVRAILAGNKTMTRRVVKPQPDMVPSPFRIGDALRAPGGRPLYCPYGWPGDRLWVRETWQCFRPGSNEPLRGSMKEHPGGIACTGFAASEDERCREYAAAVRYGGPWRPSIHMPRWASRITLEVTGLRVERLQDISEADAIAEGVRQMTDGSGCWVGREGPGKLVTPWMSARDAFRDLWESINGAGSWDANPWVWVVGFRRIEQAAAA